MITPLNLPDAVFTASSTRTAALHIPSTQQSKFSDQVNTKSFKQPPRSGVDRVFNRQINTFAEGPDYSFETRLRGPRQQPLRGNL
jgi:hypothetical protein